MRAIPLLSLLLSGWFIVPAHADEAQDWLTRLGQAEQQQSFHGTFVYERNGSFSTHNIWHRVQNGQVRERLLQLDGSAQEVVRIDGRTQCVSGTLIAGLGDSPNAAARALDPKKLKNWYDLAVIGKSRVAGRDAVIVSLTPRDQHRYGFELHLDKKTGLPLKSLLLNDKGQLLERFQFTSLDTDEIPSDKDLLADADCKPINIASDKASAAKTVQNWRSDWLPPGFELTSSSSHKDAQTKTQVSSLMYDDGLARFSVFLEPLNGATVTDTRTQLGPTVAVSRRLTTPQGEMMVTVVGEIPIGTAERIALSMRNNDGAATSKQ
ncbi:RNA polymerase subunit sigma [Pseudomonas koreensis]|jgi:sigma-E factor negative regulatory protein RseB|uniref:Sigma factor AlgU regulatory protein MucB n=3 Tax=Pseudomonas TaxID=286 RepID=A0A5E7K7A4_PSEFL|nr:MULTISPECIES: MucB/RseB C-terminal domain-containing protein [Pseudomonas]WKV85133.1 MucB/RseB C-terminal domain-containing protein [Pseudomonas sp. B24_DOA]WKV90664.1 MucB/RseB C-terminal domain-containing protein [Pseudomonas sp. B21_DOA]MDM8191109.1 MucB/RseB C-terminal domain-containing protein [Pseudomonas fluorescens]MDP8572354.1 MucB/RseB C-terminal domain-containing protein [Pseudomonas iranensis]MDR7056520.1 sigma-E factor negative regulatory protein RseB [Pseudomonas koreensis]